MCKIYVNQSNLRLTLETGVVLTGANTVQIGYKKPDGTIGYWDAEIDGTQDLYYEFVNNELDVAGFWHFFAYVVFSDGRNAPGEAVGVKVYEQGQ